MSYKVLTTEVFVRMLKPHIRRSSYLILPFGAP